jgi:hypothetical protein
MVNVMEREEFLRRLTVLDTKCTALLTLSGVVLALNMLAVTLGKMDTMKKIFSIFISLLFLISSFLALSVIWIDWKATDVTLKNRTKAYKLAVIIEAIGLVCMAGLVIIIQL